MSFEEPETSPLVPMYNPAFVYGVWEKNRRKEEWRRSWRHMCKRIIRERNERETLHREMDAVVVPVLKAHSKTLDDVRGRSYAPDMRACRTEATVALYRTGKFTITQIEGYVNRDSSSVWRTIQRHEAT